LEKRNAIPTIQDGNVDALIGTIVAEVNRLQQKYPLYRGWGCLPGTINPAEGLAVNLTNVKGWRDIPVGEIVSQKTGLVTNLENDANSMAYAEWKFGAGGTLPNVICVTLGTGIGGGLILNGRLYRGARMVAGEIGQTSIDYQGKDFVYGKKGALDFCRDLAYR
jgi:glucokinase